MTKGQSPRQAIEALLAAKGVTAVDLPILMPANPFFDLAGEEFGRRLLLTSGADGEEYCLRPDFTLPIATAYLKGGVSDVPAAFGYLGSIFRQRVDGPAEFEQAGLELICQPDADQALDRVFAFALSSLAAYGITADVRLGSVAIFEELLSQLDLPTVWRPRIRNRFGNVKTMTRLLDRLADPHGTTVGSLPWKQDELVAVVADQMVSAGLSLTGSRGPEEISARYFEKQELASAHVSSETITILRNYLNISGDARAVLIGVEGLAEDHGIDLGAPLTRLQGHIEALEAASNIGSITFDAGFSPRLDYYTGIVFEMRGGNGPLASGGEYDKLMERLGAESRITASGCSVWIDRLQAEAGK